MSCNKTDFGKIFEPYRMNDGRGFTDYRSKSEVLRDVRELASQLGCDSMDNYNLKLCLSRNGDKIINSQISRTVKDMGIYKC